VPSWVRELIGRAQGPGYLWDAEILESQPLLMNTAALTRWIERFEELGITVRMSVVQILDVERRRWVQSRRIELERELVHYKNRILLDGVEASVSDLATAEHRLDDGDFGHCVWCEEWIDCDVLEKIPEKLYCGSECIVRSREDAKRQDDYHRGDVIVSPPSARTWADVRVLSEVTAGVWPIVLSCNMQRRCFPATIGRSTPNERRHYIEGKSTFLDSVVRLVLKHSYIGGQFALYQDRIAWASSGKTFHTF
jgi:hypothetical protein